jgi:uncharacterized membrane protein YjfL (UPF0719 family)
MSAVYFLEVLLFLVIGKYIFDYLFYPRVSLEEEILAHNNAALAASFSGFLGGLGLMLKATVSLSLPALLYISLGIGLLLFSLKVLDIIFLPKVDLRKEILQNYNLAAGIIEGSFGITSGLVLYGALCGEELPLKETLLEVSIYWTLGQILAIIAGIILCMVLKLDFQKEIKRQNTAVAIAVGGVFIAAGNVVRYAISGPTLPSFFTDIKFTFIDFALAFGIFILAVLIFDFLLFKKFKFSDELKEPNLSVGIMLALLAIVLSLIW